jgi:hypothetical protein
LEDLQNAMTKDGPVNVRFAAACPEGDDPSPTHVVRGWIGRDASPASRALLERVIASFRFLRGPSGEF